jgi:hypothetical protein
MQISVDAEKRHEKMSISFQRFKVEYRSLTEAWMKTLLNDSVESTDGSRRRRGTPSKKK